MLETKRGEMGIGTLIIFISLLLVAAIAAGVLIQTSGSLQEKALTTGDQAKGQIATNVRVVEVSATDGSNGTLNGFSQIIKLAPGSEAIKLSQVLFTMNTYDRTATLKYAGTNATYVNEANGYFTRSIENLTYTQVAAGGSWEVPNFDFDEDGTADSISGGENASNVLLVMSTNGSILLGACNAGGAWVVNATLSLVRNAVGSCSGDNITEVVITPVNFGNGNFAVEYLQTGSNHVAGNLQRGDIVKLYYQAPKDIGEDEKVRINFIPKIGTPTLTEFITPEVISEERVYLYP